MTMCMFPLLVLAVLYILFWIVVAILFRKEIVSVFERDPAATSYLEVLLTYSGVHAMVFYRTAHILLKMGIPFFPRWLSQIGRFFTGIEIHPGAGMYLDACKKTADLG